MDGGDNKKEYTKGLEDSTDSLLFLKLVGEYTRVPFIISLNST